MPTVIIAITEGTTGDKVYSVKATAYVGFVLQFRYRLCSDQQAAVHHTKPCSHCASCLFNGGMQDTPLGVSQPGRAKLNTHTKKKT